MITITIPKSEGFDSEKQEFVYTDEQSIVLEHSLLSISKWESKWKKPFLHDNEKTYDETLDYIKCMTVTKNVRDEAYLFISDDQIKQIMDYISDSMTATWFSKTQGTGHGKKEIITSELIYYWMIACNIPFECEKWHINRLLTLIRVCNEKNAPPKKMSQEEIYKRNRAINEANRKRFGM